MMEGAKDNYGVSKPDITMTVDEEDELLREDNAMDEGYDRNHTNRKVCKLRPRLIKRVTNQLPQNVVNENINRQNITFDDDSDEQQNESVSESRFKTIAANSLMNRNNRIVVSNQTIPKVNRIVNDSLSLYNTIAETDAGIDNDYMQRMEDQKKKCEEIRKWKEERRFEAADDRINEVRINTRKLNKYRGRMRHNPIKPRVPHWKQTYGNTRQFCGNIQRPYDNTQQPYSNIHRPYGYIPRPSVFERLSRDAVSDLNRQFTTADRADTLWKIPSPPEPKHFSNEFNPQNSQVNYYSSNGFIAEEFETPYDDSINEETPLMNQKKTVLVKGLAPSTNEYSINAISQTVGPIVSCCIVLSNGERMAKTEFVSFRDANAFKNKFNNFTLDGCTIHTFFV